MIDEALPGFGTVDGLELGRAVVVLVARYEQRDERSGVNEKLLRLPGHGSNA